jgi:carboxylesterase type B
MFISWSFKVIKSTDLNVCAVKTSGQFYEEFLGIPFAAPPVGELRWQPPQPVQPWDGVLNATTYSLHCTQFIARFYTFLGMGGQSGEDCLYINVWVPRGVEANQ